ncbi:enoyl-CoA hydratase [Virgisporangium aliadipatigenens]|uniref:Enoyl-CoA hydratase n=1 Tax=Virgisporangium aliadipatigenens TaxID=741659 RepID=A0A8J3YM89_9ACTN|nr:enoyl-CoA hydratase [Virgisporangium aliadipatigenens]GIJ46446.1 enoyl-CoA hydratase [Virgisporangium aliadipatigenens]
MAPLETGTPHLTATVDDGVAVLTMCRPERRNAFSMDMLTALGSALNEVDDDPAVRVVVLTGAGGAFCAGGDVKDFATRTDEAWSSSFEERLRFQRVKHRSTTLRLWELTKPTVAVLPGPAAGAGLSLALACDLRYAADTAVLTTAFAKVGLAGDFGGGWLMSRLVGTAVARELYYLSEVLDAAEAQRLGLLNAVFPAADLQKHAMERVRRIADGPATAIRYMKENLNRAEEVGLADYLDLEAIHHQRTFDTADHREAARAFVEKRAPKFGA